ncbi:MAG: UDP-N-acetyl-D-mannosamine dehydrogenase [Desulfovibrio sp.]|nr:UDP-N-acetyl-D-mannosamine dehydrogenase [Desulfovibrio sp.]
MKIDKVVVYGLGYIGLPTATLLASRGATARGVDVTDHVIDSVNAGKMHIVEPGLGEILKKAVDDGKLSAGKEPEEADAFIIAVPTPFKEGHKPDLSYIKAAAKSMAPVLRKGNVVILESTSPVGATEQLAEWLAAERPDLTFPQTAGEEADVQIAYCPERVLPGKVVQEMVENDRIMGGLSKKAGEMAADVYRVFVTGDILLTDARTAEMCKLTENSFRDVNIAFANELSIICDKLGINVWELIKLANRHPRVDILNPGCGVGGHCIAVDPWFIVDSCPDEAKIIGAARNINDNKPEFVVEKAKKELDDFLNDHPDKKINDVVVASLGLAFKPNIDDLRESPAIEIALDLAATGAKVLAVEPNISQLPPKLAEAGLELATLDDALDRADVIVLNTPHNEFMENLERLHAHPRLINSVCDNPANSRIA